MGSCPSESFVRRVGIVYDDRMCKHLSPDGDGHPEKLDRIRAIWTKLQENHIPQRCLVFSATEGKDKYIEAVHSKKHVNLIKNISSKKFASRCRIASKYNSIYFNEGSSEAAYLAVGSVLEVSEKVAMGELNSAAVIVRPPGHHAEHDEAMGFCLFNNVAIAANYLLNERLDLNVKKIMIVDWDVHHGNGTQKMFWEDPRVLFFSVHRHEFGDFYPYNGDGFYTMIGGGHGMGYNINVPWEHGKCGDADYLAVWDHVLIPVANEFNPDLILVSAGFDAAIGDPLGGCRVTPYGYSIMLKKLMDFAQGKIVLVLEGGYDLVSLASSFLACVQVLLEANPTIIESLKGFPFQSTWRVIQSVRKQLCPYWHTLADELPLGVTHQATPLFNISNSDSERDEEEGNLDMMSKKKSLNVEEITGSLVKLRVGHDEAAAMSAGWRSELAKIDVWYAAFGSNLWKPRFLCYIEGGQVDGMKTPCSGSMDPSLPKQIAWKMVPHRLFFGRDFTQAWGHGGVAFLNPEHSNNQRAYTCLYKITLEQFNDVIQQENDTTFQMSSPVFDLAALDGIANEGSVDLGIFFKEGWYPNVVYLGSEHDIPILTITCPLSVIQKFKSGELTLSAPSEGYHKALLKGLAAGAQLSEEEAIAYLNEASKKPL